MAPIKADIKFINFTCVQFRNCSSCVAQSNASKFNKTSIANRELVTSASNCVKFHGHALTYSLDTKVKPLTVKATTQQNIKLHLKSVGT